MFCKKVIGESTAMRAIEKYVKDEAKNGSIIAYPIWGGTPSELENVEKIKMNLEKNPKIDIKGRFQIGPVIGAHSGPIYGVVFYPKIN